MFFFLLGLYGEIIILMGGRIVYFWFVLLQGFCLCSKIDGEVE